MTMKMTSQSTLMVVFFTVKSISGVGTLSLVHTTSERVEGTLAFWGCRGLGGLSEVSSVASRVLKGGGELSCFFGFWGSDSESLCFSGVVVWGSRVCALE